MSQGLVISSAPQTTSTLLLPLLEPEFRAGHGPAGRLGTWEQEQHGWRGLKSPASCYTWAGLGWGRAVGTAGEDRAHGQSRWSREAEASLLAWGSVYKWIHLFQLISWGKTRPRRMVQSSVGS